MTAIPGTSGAEVGQASVQGWVAAQHTLDTIAHSNLPYRPTNDDFQDHAEPMSISYRPATSSTGFHPLGSSAQDAPLHNASRSRLSSTQHKTISMIRNDATASSKTWKIQDDDGDEVAPSYVVSHGEVPFAHMRIHFDDFARQLRLHRHHEHRKRIIDHQKTYLCKAVALSARLQRVGSWVHDGLVQISQQSDPNGFTRVHQHMHDLVESCQTEWQREIHALDAPSGSKASIQPSFLAALPTPLQEDCLHLIDTLRHHPRFLVDRFKAMSPEQVQGLSTSPKFRNLDASVLVSLSENRGRDSLRRRPRSFLREQEEAPQLLRSRAYSKELEDYALSLERSNPLSFLIHNIFAATSDISCNESQLRFSMWSMICADLFMESESAFHAVIADVLSAFAHLYGWQIKARLEMFLMGSLQRGAFLYNSVDPSSGMGRKLPGIFESLSTPQAQAFFDAEVKELFQILGSGDGGIPAGALQLGRAIVEKLPTTDSQGAFRGYFFFRWFLPDFLRIAMSFPEDESMLLQFHVSDRARLQLLHKLWEHASAKASDVMSSMPTHRVDEEIRNSINWNISQIYAEKSIDPYEATRTSEPSFDAIHASSIVICAADIAHLLEKLKPQVMHNAVQFDRDMHTLTSSDPSLHGSRAVFHLSFEGGNIPGGNTRFDQLRKHMVGSIEPGHSSKNVHPSRENWATISITTNGHLSTLERIRPAGLPIVIESLGELNPAEDAALRLASSPQLSRRSKTSYGGIKSDTQSQPLLDMFAERSRTSHIETDSLTAIYWHNAVKYMRKHYPLTVLTGDDTKILEPLVQKVGASLVELKGECLRLEQELSELESAYVCAQASLTVASKSLTKLRTKLWYSKSVIGSNAYDNARNITAALTNMAISPLGTTSPSQDRASSPASSRPGTSATSASSIFDQPRVDTELIMKAPADHGGPGKLSDNQIEKTKKWLERNHVENFCRGEERFHRFCMEVKLVTRQLIGDTFAESPVLWSSELFAREKTLYDIHDSLPLFNGLPSTRSPSVMSEPLSSASGATRGVFAGMRTSIFAGSSRVGRESLVSDTSSYGGSSRATTFTTPEDGIFSPAPSNARSDTSASLRSRPASIFSGAGGAGISRSVDRSQEKSAFLENLRHDLNTLLLSDLACPVWTCGSESDAWMDAICQTPTIIERLHQRSALAGLLPSAVHAKSTITNTTTAAGKNKQRSRSVAPRQALFSKADPATHLRNASDALTLSGGPAQPTEFPYLRAFNDILCRVKDHTDPMLKLQAMRDFKVLSQDFQRHHQLDKHEVEPASDSQVVTTEKSTRRRSLDPNILSSNLRRGHRRKASTPDDRHSESEENTIIKCLKDLLLILRPKTIFRDLQYIAVFVSSDNLAGGELEQAFLHIGLAALAWKDEVCRAMLDVADRIVARDSIKRNVPGSQTREPSVLKAMDYWIIGAREGNAIAQRELASLYLTHPDVPPIVSLPLALSSEVFRGDMMWERPGELRRDNNALCLALHWMQAAADNGDVVAQAKLRERQAGYASR